MTVAQTENAFVAALAAKGDQPTVAMDAFGAHVIAVTGARLVTLMTSDPDTGEAQRIYSNMPQDYPVSGSKPMNRTHWSEVVLEKHETYVANDIATIAGVFFDHEQIAALGCEAVVNLPIVLNGTVLGTINCLDRAGYFTPERVADLDVLRLPGAAAFLFHRMMTKGVA